MTAPTLVVYGEKSPAVLKEGSRALAEAVPNAQPRELEGVSDNLKMNVLAPVLAEFFAGAAQGSGAPTANGAKRG